MHLGDCCFELFVVEPEEKEDEETVARESYDQYPGPVYPPLKDEVTPTEQWIKIEEELSEAKEAAIAFSLDALSLIHI